MPENEFHPAGPGQVPRAEVAQALGAVARSLESEPDLHHTARAIVCAVTDTVPGAEDAGVALWEERALRTVAATSDLIDELNQIEHRLREGPCVQAVAEHHTYRIDEMTQEERWPRFTAAAAAARGVGSMLGYRLFTRGRTLGALDLYSSKPQAFDAESELIGELFAAHAAIAVIGAARQAEWQAAVTSRDVIGMAKGIVMNRENVTDEQAFELLVSTSQRANVKVHEVAAWLVSQANEAARPG